MGFELTAESFATLNLVNGKVEYDWQCPNRWQVVRSSSFPVLARILTDRNLQNTPVGTVALSCAAADDVTAWCLLSLVVGVAKAEVGNVAFVIGGALAFILIMFFITRPLLNRYVIFWIEIMMDCRPTRSPVFM